MFISANPFEVYLTEEYGGTLGVLERVCSESQSIVEDLKSDRRITFVATISDDDRAKFATPFPSKIGATIEVTPQNTTPTDSLGIGAMLFDDRYEYKDTDGYSFIVELPANQFESLASTARSGRVPLEITFELRGLKSSEIIDRSIVEDGVLITSVRFVLKVSPPTLIKADP